MILIFDAERAVMVRMRAAVLGVAIASLGLVSGCTSAGDGGAADGTDTISVVVPFYPLEEIARRVGGDAVEVVNLTPPGAEPHDVELTARDVATVQEADVVLYLGGGFQPGVEEASARASGRSVDLLEASAGVAAGDTATDPHAWLDPGAMVAMTEAARDAFAEADPDDAGAYERNADAYVDELESLDDAFAATLGTCERRVLVTSHDAFGHLAARYDLRQEPIAGLSPENEPSASRMARLRELVEREGVTTIFTETLVSPRVAEALAGEAGVETAVLNPIEGLTTDERESGETYVGLMRANLEILARALGCEATP